MWRECTTSRRIFFAAWPEKRGAVKPGGGQFRTGAMQIFVKKLVFGCTRN
jgi:hypothetical protein